MSDDARTDAVEYVRDEARKGFSVGTNAIRQVLAEVDRLRAELDRHRVAGSELAADADAASHDPFDVRRAVEKYRRSVRGDAPAANDAPTQVASPSERANSEGGSVGTSVPAAAPTDGRGTKDLATAKIEQAKAGIRRWQTDLTDVEPKLIEALRELGGPYGPMGVALAAARLSHPPTVVRLLTENSTVGTAPMPAPAAPTDGQVPAAVSWDDLHRAVETVRRVMPADATSVICGPEVQEVARERLPDGSFRVTTARRDAEVATPAGWISESSGEPYGPGTVVDVIAGEINETLGIGVSWPKISGVAHRAAARLRREGHLCAYDAEPPAAAPADDTPASDGQAPADGTPAERHEPVTVGLRDAEGYRTHAPGGDVCAACSDFDAGRLVPVSQCPDALAEYDRRLSADPLGADPAAAAPADDTAAPDLRDVGPLRRDLAADIARDGSGVDHLSPREVLRRLDALPALADDAATPPVWPDDIGAVLRDLQDDLVAFRVQCRHDGEVLRAVGVGDALDMIAGRIARHPRRAGQPVRDSQPRATARLGQPCQDCPPPGERVVECGSCGVAVPTYAAVESGAVEWPDAGTAAPDGVVVSRVHLRSWVGLLRALVQQDAIRTLNARDAVLDYARQMERWAAGQPVRDSQDGACDA